MKPEQSSLERMHVKGTPTEDIRAWCGFAHKVVERTGPSWGDATLELWLHEDSADMLLDMCDEVDEMFESLRELVHDLLLLPSVPAFDCFGCRYEKHHDCECGLRCKLIERAKALGIEVERGKRTRG